MDGRFFLVELAFELTGCDFNALPKGKSHLNPTVQHFKCLKSGDKTVSLNQNLEDVPKFSSPNQMRCSLGLVGS